MKIGPFEFRRAETRANPEDPTVPVSAKDFLAYFGVQTGNLPIVTIDTALTVPSFSAAVTFLSSSLANLPVHVYRSTDEGSEKAPGNLQRILNEAPNPGWSSFAFRKYLWTQVFTGGRGFAWIERSGSNIVALWPVDPADVTVTAARGVRTYTIRNRGDFASGEIIDIPFLLKRDQVSSYSPLVLGAKAIQLALAMNDYGSGFFAGGGVPPLALVGPMPAGPEAMRRALADVKRAIDTARESSTPVTNIPPGYELKPIGFDPEKGQMTDARRFQVEEIARLYNLPPVFLQDLTHGTFSNTEQQDLHLVKHLIAQWSKALEDELNLKLFGARRNARFVEHSLDGLMRGAFKDRIEGLVRGVQGAILTPDEARALENRPPKENGDRLYVQGATVPLGSQPAANGDTDGNGTQGA